MRIGVFGHYGNANLGDEAIVQATLESLRRRIAGVELACFTINATDSAQRHGVPSYPIRNIRKPMKAFPLEGEPPLPESGFSGPVTDSLTDSATDSGGLRGVLKRSDVLRSLVNLARTILKGARNTPSEIGFLYKNYKLLKSFDMIMVTGSNQFLDNFGGLWGFPYTVLKWGIITRLAGCKFALVSLGAGPLDGKMSKQFCRWSLALSHHASYRDQPSRRIIEGDGPDYKGKVYPDVATNIDLPESNARDDGHVLNVGINPMPVFDKRYWHEGNDAKYAAYLDKLVAMVRHIQSSGHHATLFSTQIQDNAVIGDVLARLESTERNALTVRQPRTVEDLLVVLESLDVSIPTRFHGTVLSLRSGKPTLGICYHRKIGDLLTDVGLADFQVPFEAFTVTNITGLIDKLIAERHAATSLIEVANVRYLELLDKQYDELAALVGH